MLSTLELRVAHPHDVRFVQRVVEQLLRRDYRLIALVHEPRVRGVRRGGCGALVRLAPEAVEEVEARAEADGVGVLGGYGPAGDLVDAANVAAHGGGRGRDGREEGAPGGPLAGRGGADAP